MEIHVSNNGRGHFSLPWQNKEHRLLPYVNEPFNDPKTVAKWEGQGYTNTQFTGGMYDMRNPWLRWIDITPWQDALGWKQMSWSFYKMETGTILPEHVDTFSRFKTLHPDEDPDTIHRAIVFLEDWQPGHVLTLGQMQCDPWAPGSFVWWKHDVPHLAANIGLKNRFTLQLTGFKK